MVNSDTPSSGQASRQRSMPEQVALVYWFRRRGPDVRQDQEPTGSTYSWVLDPGEEAVIRLRHAMASMPDADAEERALARRWPFLSAHHGCTQREKRLFSTLAYLCLLALTQPESFAELLAGYDKCVAGWPEHRVTSERIEAIRIEVASLVPQATRALERAMVRLEKWRRFRTERDAEAVARTGQAATEEQRLADERAAEAWMAEAEENGDLDRLAGIE